MYVLLTTLLFLKMIHFKENVIKIFVACAQYLQNEK